ncbi:MAG TPA: alpha-ketoacid dehydrogenase subunit beta [Opitutales bacterium]|nr:alpha-ketoacid dehydrogenase subunit beta [Opitutales bacterium]
MQKITYREAVNQAIAEEMERDEKVFLMGEEVAEYQGAYKVTRDLLQRFGPKRVIDTPISEAGFSGLGIGASMLGLRPIVEFMTWSFSFVAFDQIANNAGNIRYMSGGLINLPIVFRGPANGGVNVGSTHSHHPENLYAHFPGIKVICPSNAYDAKGLLKTAIRDNDPVCVMEDTRLYDHQMEIPTEEYTIPLGSSDVKREGTDISLIAHGRAVVTSLQAAELLKERDGINAEVVDLRSIRPLDTDGIIETVKKTNRVVLVEETKPFCGIGAQVAYVIQDLAFDFLDAPIKRVSSLDVPQPYSDPLEKMVVPDAERVYNTCLEIL